jgi:hypothetical protein
LVSAGCGMDDRCVTRRCMSLRWLRRWGMLRHRVGGSARGCARGTLCGGSASERSAGGRGEQRQPVLLDGRRVSNVEWREEEVESRYEATLAVGLVIVLQVTLALVSLAGGWKLIGLPGWVWLIPVVPETALLLALAWSAPRYRLEQLGRRRTVALALVAVITTANVLALVALIASLLSAEEKSGGGAAAEGRHDLGHERDHVRPAVLGVRPRRPDPPP